MGIVGFSLLALLAVGVQVAGRFGLGPRVPIGDEAEYLARARAPDPFGPHPFLRVPVVAFLAWAAGPEHTEARLRNIFACLVLMTAACVGAAGYLSMGPAGAITATIVFVLLPDRILLSQHIWPDVVLSLWQGILLLLIAWSVRVAPVPSWCFGTVAAAAAMTRIDAVILLPALTVVGAALHESLAPELAALWLPALAVLAACTLRNSRRYGIRLPDDTFLFNIVVLGEEHRQSASADVPVETLVRSVGPGWFEVSQAESRATFRRAAAAIAQRPFRLLRGVIGRTWQMLGADTFVTERLLHPVEGAYPQMPEAMRAVIGRSARVGFPILVALAVAGAAADGLARLCLVPGVAVFLASSVIQGRTRYRHSLLPPLSVAAATGLLAMADRSQGWKTAIVAVGAACLLLRAPRRREQPERAVKSTTSQP